MVINIWGIIISIITQQTYDRCFLCVIMWRYIDVDDITLTNCISCPRFRLQCDIALRNPFSQNKAVWMTIWLINVYKDDISRSHPLTSFCYTVVRHYNTLDLHYLKYSVLLMFVTFIVLIWFTWNNNIWLEWYKFRLVVTFSYPNWLDKYQAWIISQCLKQKKIYHIKQIYHIKHSKSILQIRFK